jgi:hypothetical protein
MKITHKSFSETINDSISEGVAKIIDSLDMEYEDLSNEENISAISKICEISDGDLKKSGKHRAHEWEHGWSENRDLLKEKMSFDSVLPKYFGKFPYLRFGKKLIKQKSIGLEYKMLCSLEYHYFSKYLLSCKNIFEFGCGTGHNLFRARQLNPSANLTGLDWASSSQDILNELNKNEVLKCNSHKFDFYDPDYKVDIPEETGIYTIAALEQIGTSHENFLQYILSKKPKVCLHVEPIVELLDPAAYLLDDQCVKYCEKRNYLKGFLPRLRELEKEGKVEIIEAKRTNVGSFLIEGYSVVVWRPTV